MISGDKSNPDRILVAYYSASGCTRRAANYIAAAAGSDLVLPLEPTQPYTGRDLDWMSPTSRVSREHSNPSERNVPLVHDTVDDWELYSTVFIGYPIWWGIAAWPVDTFVKTNNFTGKTVVPFATSASTGIGQSGHLLERMAGTGRWLAARRFPSPPSESVIRAWVAELDS